MVKPNGSWLMVLALLASFSFGSESKPGSAQPSSSPGLSEVLAPSLKPIKDPQSVIGSGWNEQAAKAAAGVDTEQLEEVRDGSSMAIQRALSEAASTLGIPSPVVAPKDDRAKADDQPSYRLYVSQAMGDAALKDAIAMAQSHRSMHIVLRGVLPGQTVMSLYGVLKRVHGAFDEKDPPPTIQIDPTVFTAAHVSSVPTLEKLDGKGASIALVRGVMDPDWLDRAIAENKHGDLGSFGQTVAVSEINMLDQLKAEAAKLDYADLAEKAKARFWSTYRFTTLGTAKTKRDRYIDPTVEVKDDIMTVDGKLVARKGDRFNPLESVPFTQTLVVFDATSPAQLAFAKRYLSEHPNKRVTLITSRVDPDRGWNGYSELERDLDHAVFVLQEDVRSTFQIEKVPSTVMQSDMKFLVSEIPVDMEAPRASAKP